MSDLSRIQEAIKIINNLYEIHDRLDDNSHHFIMDMAAKAEQYENDLYVSDKQWEWLLNLEEKYL